MENYTWQKRTLEQSILRWATFISYYCWFKWFRYKLIISLHWKIQMLPYIQPVKQGWFASNHTCAYVSICMCHFCEGKRFHCELFVRLKGMFNLWVITLHHFPTQLQVIFKKPKECPKFVPKMSRWAHSHTTPINSAGQVWAARSAHYIHTLGGTALPSLPAAGSPATCTRASPSRSHD